jgi:putative SOS response-associated peptidase YedK
MCGRFVVAKTVGEILTIFEADEIVGDVPGISYNVAPTQQIAIVVDRSFEKAADGSPIGELNREIHSARWGLVPRWAKDAAGAPLINVRSPLLSMTRPPQVSSSRYSITPDHSTSCSPAAESKASDWSAPSSG